MTDSTVAARRRDLLRLMLSSGAFKLGDFTLKSGQKSPIYIDLRELIAFPKVKRLASVVVEDVLKEISFDSVVGVPYGALPYAVMVSDMVEKPLLIVRKEVKEHGAKKQIEGRVVAGEKVVVVEDVVTSGGSVKDVVTLLRKEGLVVTDVICLLDRQQGGREALQAEGITLHNFPLARISLENRKSIGSGNALTARTFTLMTKKESNVCIALDYTQSTKMAELAGPFVMAVKIHADAIVDFSTDFTDRLVALAKKHDFLIFEDRKFADTAATMTLQLTGYQHIASWADLVTIHALPGAKSVVDALRPLVADPNLRLSGALLIAQLSTEGALTNEDYVNAEENADVITGFICQRRISDQPTLLHWTPGVHLEAKADGRGQQWRGVEQAIGEAEQNDIVIVGRGVTENPRPVNALVAYRELAWKTLPRNEK